MAGKVPVDAQWFPAAWRPGPEKEVGYPYFNSQSQDQHHDPQLRLVNAGCP